MIKGNYTPVVFVPTQSDEGTYIRLRNGETKYIIKRAKKGIDTPTTWNQLVRKRKHFFTDNMSEFYKYLTKLLD